MSDRNGMSLHVQLPGWKHTTHVLRSKIPNTSMELVEEMEIMALRTEFHLRKGLCSRCSTIESVSVRHDSKECLGTPHKNITVLFHKVLWHVTSQLLCSANRCARPDSSTQTVTTRRSLYSRSSGFGQKKERFMMHYAICMRALLL